MSKLATLIESTRLMTGAARAMAMQGGFLTMSPGDLETAVQGLRLIEGNMGILLACAGEALPPPLAHLAELPAAASAAEMAVSESGGVPL